MTVDAIELSPTFPAKMQALFIPRRYKVFHGGRGGGKSHSIAEYLVMCAAQDPIRVLCCREFQNSIKESVHRLLCDKIASLGLEHCFEITQTGIRGVNGSEFLFEGLRHNISKIKSLEGIDKAWLEEAQTATKESLDVLIPTIRHEGSEIIASMNPEFEEDEMYKRFVLADPPPDSIVVKINHDDNPYFPDVLQRELDHLKAVNKDEYLHVWEGHIRKALEGAVYADELRRAYEESRITKVPREPGKPVYTGWDLGSADQTAITFYQVVGMEVRVIDYYENQFKKVDHYLKVLQERGYLYAEHNLPHDGGNETLAGKSIKRQIEEVYPGQVRVIPRTTSVNTDIEQCRIVWEKVWIDEAKGKGLIYALTRYAYEQNTKGRWSNKPRHDAHSNGADSFRSMCMAMKTPKAKPKIDAREFSVNRGPQSWM